MKKTKMEIEKLYKYVVLLAEQDDSVTDEECDIFTVDEQTTNNILRSKGFL